MPQVRKSHKCWVDLGSNSFQILSAEVGLRIENSVLYLDLFLKLPVESFHLELKSHMKSTQAEKTLANVCLICPLNLSSGNPTAFFTVVQMRETWKKKKFLAYGSFTKGEGQISLSPSEKGWFGLYFSTPWCILRILIESACPCA